MLVFEVDGFFDDLAVDVLGQGRVQPVLLGHGRHPFLNLGDAFGQHHWSDPLKVGDYKEGLTDEGEFA